MPDQGNNIHCSTMLTLTRALSCSTMRFAAACHRWLSVDSRSSSIDGWVSRGGSTVDGWVSSGGSIIGRWVSIGGFTVDRWIIHGWVGWGNVSIRWGVGRGAVFVISRRGIFITLMIQFQSCHVVDLCQDFVAVIHIAQLECALAKDLM